MGILSGIGGLLGGNLGTKIAEIVGNRIEDKGKAALAQLELEKAIGDREHEVEMALIDRDKDIAVAQAATNTAEAQSGNLFNSAWRPSAGYVCVLGLLYQFLLQPVLSWVSGMNHWAMPPLLDLGSLMTLLAGMLGLGTLRTTERLNGVIPPGK